MVKRAAILRMSAHRVRAMAGGRRAPRKSERACAVSFAWRVTTMHARRALARLRLWWRWRGHPMALFAVRRGGPAAMERLLADVDEEG